MTTKKKTTLAVFWADNRQLLTPAERRSVLQNAALESVASDEVLMRESSTGRLIVVTSTDEKGLFCVICKDDLLHKKYGQSCPSFAKCAVKMKHRGPAEKS